LIHRTIKKVTEDIESRFHFNTAIAAIMELFNALSAKAQGESRLEMAMPVVKAGLERIIIMLYPFVPHVTSELWEALGHRDPLHTATWPQYSETALEEEKLLIVVQVNGKVRGKITVSADMEQSRIESQALQDHKVRTFLDGKTVQKVIHVPRKLVNIVVEG
jgi:leucyl-tRNA synthetase